MSRGNSLATMTVELMTDASGVITGAEVGKQALRGYGDTASRVSTQVSQALQKNNGDISRSMAGMGKKMIVLQQMGFGLEDFMSQFQTMGLAGGLRAASNNLSMAAASLHPIAGVFAGIGASTLPILINNFQQASGEIQQVASDYDVATAAAKRYADQLERISRGTRFDRNLADSKTADSSVDLLKGKSREIEDIEEKMRFIEGRSKGIRSTFEEMSQPLIADIIKDEQMMAGASENNLKKMSPQQRAAHRKRVAEMQQKIAENITAEWQKAIETGEVDSFFAKHGGRASSENLGLGGTFWQIFNPMGDDFEGRTGSKLLKSTGKVPIEDLERAKDVQRLAQMYEENQVAIANEMREQNKLMEEKAEIQKKLNEQIERESDSEWADVQQQIAEGTAKFKERQRQEALDNARAFINEEKAWKSRVRDNERFFESIAAAGADDPTMASLLRMQSGLKDQIDQINEITGGNNFAGPGRDALDALGRAANRDIEELLKQTRDPLNKTVLASGIGASSSEGVSYLNRIAYGTLVKPSDDERKRIVDLVSQIKGLLEKNGVTLEVKGE
jgi:hypothetical protein